MAGFTRHGGRQAIENWIIGYLKLVSSGGRLREETKFIEKAIVLINQVFGHPCCDSPTSVVSFITPYDNQLTHTIEQLVNKDRITRRSFRLSLLRILDILNGYLYGCCTETVTINYLASTPPASVILQVFDPISGDVLFASNPIGGNTQTFTVSTKYFGPASFMKVCLLTITPPAGGHTEFTVSDGTGVLATATVAGTVCSTEVKPLQTVYNISQS